MALTKTPIELSSTPSIVDGGNATAITIDSSENVGIGNTPAYKLDVASPVIQFGDSTDAFVQYKSSAGNWHVGANSSNAFAFYSGTYGSGTERMRIDSGGNLQLGTGTPAYLVGTGDIAQLSVNRVGTSGAITNTSRSAAFINVNGANGGSSIEFSTASANNTQPSERMRIDSSGNVGIGGVPNSWSTVTNVLQMKDQTVLSEHAGTGYLTQNWYYNAGEKYIGNGYAVRQAISSVDGHWSLENAGNNTSGAGAGLSWQERMRIDASGNLLVGKTVGNSPSTIGFEIQQDGEVYSTIASGFNTYHVYANSGYRFYVNPNGGLYNYSANNVNLSDKREKKNIEALESQWDSLKQWSLKKFHYNADDNSDTKKLGVIAQEVEVHNPELISEFSVDEDTTRMAVKEQQMVWMAIKALQEAQTRIETLEAKVQELENN